MDWPITNFFATLGTLPNKHTSLEPNSKIEKAMVLMKVVSSEHKVQGKRRWQ